MDRERPEKEGGEKRQIDIQTGRQTDRERERQKQKGGGGGGGVVRYS